MKTRSTILSLAAFATLSFAALAPSLASASDLDDGYVRSGLTGHHEIGGGYNVDVEADGEGLAEKLAQKNNSGTSVPVT